MKKIVFLLILLVIICCGYSSPDEETTGDEGYSIQSLYDFQKKYVGEEMEVCSSSSSKTYMDYRAINNTRSKQYKYIQEYMTVDETGLLVDQEGFIGAALGSYFGKIGDRFYFTLDSGIVLPLVMIDAKANTDTANGCMQAHDKSVIEFVIDTNLAAEYFGRFGNGLVLQGNFNNYKLFRGEIVKVEKVTEVVNEKYVTYSQNEDTYINEDIFQYASGY